jgi:5-methylcytosine-specific restriction endonuclease McrA
MRGSKIRTIPPFRPENRMTDLTQIGLLLTELNKQFVRERMAITPLHTRLMKRTRKSPHRRVFWNYKMPDDIPRECQYCGTVFLPDNNRIVGFVSAPVSVEYAHRRAHCGPHCDSTNLRGLKSAVLKREEIFERDGWHCYLCNQPTPPDLRGFAYVPNAPSVDHVVPKGWGTDEQDNLRCCCRLCNLEKGSATIWDKLSIYVRPSELSHIFPIVMASALPRHPTVDEMRYIWRTYYLCEGKYVEDFRDEIFLEVVHMLSEHAGS